MDMILTRKWIVWPGMLLGLLLLWTSVHAQEKLVLSRTGPGEWVGQTIALRLLKAAYREAGIEIEVEEYPAERAVLMAAYGETAGVLTRMEGLESLYPSLVRIPVPVSYLELMCYTRAAAFRVSGWESLRPYRIVSMLGDKLTAQNTAGMRVTAVATPEQAFKMLAAGRADVAVQPRDIPFTMQLTENGEIRMLKPPLATLPTYHYLNRRHEHFVPRLTTLLTRLHHAGEFSRIQAEEMARFRAGHGK
jgi:polar amino acid transport system substrate-binding protein